MATLYVFVVYGRLMSDVEVKAFDDIMQDATKKHLGLDVSRMATVCAILVLFVIRECVG